MSSTKRALSFWCTVMDWIKHVAILGIYADLGVAFGLLPRLYRPAAIPVACLLPIFILYALLPSRVITGDDGVQWHHFIPFVRPRFLSYGEIKTIEPNPHGCMIMRTNGQGIRLSRSRRTPNGTPMMGTDAVERAAVWRTRLRDEIVPALPETIDDGPYRSGEDSELDVLLSIAAMPHAPPGI